MTGSLARRRSHRPLRLIALATAALLALVVGAWWAGTSSRSGAEIAAAPPLREVRVPMGQRAQFQLIDGTRVLAAIDLERQLELAFEGERWPDLVRTGRAVEELGIPEYQTLYPIPQTEIDVAPGITQNPGY